MEGNLYVFKKGKICNFLEIGGICNMHHWPAGCDLPGAGRVRPTLLYCSALWYRTLWIVLECRNLHTRPSHLFWDKSHTVGQGWLDAPVVPCILFSVLHRKYSAESVPLKVFHWKCYTEHVPLKVFHWKFFTENVTLNMFHWKCSTESVPLKVFHW